jgi:hypothetical protein
VGLGVGVVLAGLVHWMAARRAYRRRRALAARSVAWWTTPTRTRRSRW